MLLFFFMGVLKMTSMASLCQVCTKAPFKYTCPRCEIIYCSVACFENHSTDCTEAFYKCQVTDNLGNSTSQPQNEENQRLEQVLHELRNLDIDPNHFDDKIVPNHFDDKNDPRTEGDGDDAEEEYEPLITNERVEELRKIALEGNITELNLTKEELKLFRSDLARGLIAIEPVTAWWDTVLLGDPSSSKISHVCCSTEGEPNSLVAHSIIQVLYAYAHMYRYYNGEVYLPQSSGAPKKEPQNSETISESENADLVVAQAVHLLSLAPVRLCSNSIIRLCCCCSCSRSVPHHQIGSKQL
eukprot:Selendium_serpulae@DN4600_c0_g1_i10.p1